MIQYDSINTLDSLYSMSKRKVSNLKKRPTDNELLLLYSLYKQSEHGDNNTTSPWLIDIKAFRKWNAWKEQEGKEAKVSKQEYIDLVKILLEKYN